MSYDILKNLGLDRVDPGSPDFLRALDRMQREAWESLQCSEPGFCAELGLGSALDE